MPDGRRYAAGVPDRVREDALVRAGFADPPPPGVVSPREQYRLSAAAPPEAKNTGAPAAEAVTLAE
jgi:hypothetical protein